MTSIMETRWRDETTGAERVTRIDLTHARSRRPDPAALDHAADMDAAARIVAIRWTRHSDPSSVTVLSLTPASTTTLR